MCIRDHNAWLASNWFLIPEASQPRLRAEARNAATSAETRALTRRRNIRASFNRSFGPCAPFIRQPELNYTSRRNKTRCARAHAQTENSCRAVSLGRSAGDFNARTGELVRFRAFGILQLWRKIYRMVHWFLWKFYVLFALISARRDVFFQTFQPFRVFID